MKKLIPMLLSIALICTFLPNTAFAANAVDSGMCGDNITWSLDSDGVLTISGTGKMKDYFIYENIGGIHNALHLGLPWADYTHDVKVKQVIVNHGVTCIGAGAFENLKSLTTITVPSSLTRIEWVAFSGCGNLANIYFTGSEMQWNRIEIGEANEPLLNAKINYNFISGNTNASIPADAVYFQGNYYKIYTGSFTWETAKEQCANLNGHLATITSESEQNFIESINTGNRNLWIGGYRDDLFNWYWVTGEAWNYTHWGSGEPNDSSNVVSNENCVAIWPKYWNDLNNSNTREQSGYICEWDSLPASTEADRNNAIPALSLVSSTPTNGARDVVDDTLALTFNADISHNLNWSAGSIQIKDYSTGQTVRTFDSRMLIDNRVHAFVSGATLTIEGALDTLDDGRQYYLSIPDGLILSADGRASFAGFGEYQFFFRISDGWLETVNTEKKVTVYFSDKEMQIDWNWDYLSGNATEKTIEESKKPAIAALVLSEESVRPDTVRWNLETLGFDNFYSTCYDFDTFLGLGKANHPGVAFASTQKIIDGKKKTIIAAVVRGSTTKADWLRTNPSSLLDGFSDAADNVKRELNQYIAEYCPSISRDDTILLITGHSLGGGVAGALSLRTADIARQENTFVYTFAGTNYLTAGHDAQDYPNVINYINMADYVPYLPPATKSHSKVGRNITLGIKGISSAQEEKLNAAYREITGSSESFRRATQSDSWESIGKRHVVQAYMALILSDLSSSASKEYFTVASVHCPVDVEVYNGIGALMAGVMDGKISYSSNTEVLILVDGDEKYVYMPPDTEYQIKLTGTDTGTMQYVVQNIDAETGEAVTEKVFSDIPLYSGKRMANEIGGSSEVAGTRLFVLDEQGKNSEEIPGVVRGNAVNRFTDVSPNAYYYDAVMWALTNNVTDGTSATTFSPDTTCTRAQVVTFLWRAMGRPAPSSTNNPFEDVKAGQYYTDAVLWAIEKGITNGTSYTTFSPNDTCTNAQILTFIWRCLGEQGKTGTGTWYEDALNWATRESLLRDTGATTSVNGQCPRRDVVTFLYRALA